MSRIVDFPDGDNLALRRARAQRNARLAQRARSRGITLCRRGFHKWKVDGDTRFDVKQGRLVTTVRCERCGEARNELR